MSILLKMISLWWKKNPTRGKICLFVLLFHFIGLYQITANLEILPKKKSSLTVRTITPARPQITPKQITTQASSPKPTPKKQTPAKPVTATPQKKTTPTNVKPSIEKKTEPTRPAKKKEKTLRNRQQLQESLQKIEKSITQIERKHDKLKNPRELTVPSQPLMPSSSTVLEEDARYVSSLVGYLQEHLRLPDVGEVKMEIHLHSDGKVESIKVLSAESILNRKKLEDILPTLQFPIPPSNNRIFIVTFCHNL